MWRDPTTTNPDHYTVIMENDQVRVLEYRDTPGAVTTPHDHPDSVMVTLSSFRRRLHAEDRFRDVQIAAVARTGCRASGTTGRTSATPTPTSSSSSSRPRPPPVRRARWDRSSPCPMRWSALSRSRGLLPIRRRRGGVASQTSGSRYGAPIEEAAMTGATTKSFDTPDEQRSPPNTVVDVVHLGAHAVARFTFAPGWRWSTDVAPTAGTDSCQARHVGSVQSGALHVTHTDGSHIDVTTGDASSSNPATTPGWSASSRPCSSSSTAPPPTPGPPPPASTSATSPRTTDPPTSLPNSSPAGTTPGTPASRDEYGIGVCFSRRRCGA